MKNQVYCLASDYVLHSLDESVSGYHLFNLTDGKIFKLNKVAYSMLEAIDGERAIGEIISGLKIKYDANPDEIETDFLSLVQKWADSKIIIEKGG